MRPLDTTPEAERAQLEAFRRMGLGGRLKAGLALSRTCRDLMREGVRKRHPEYDDDQIRLAVIRLMLPEELFLEAYPGAREIRP
jgi:beta-phosphoglucomutase-like phosphatase (HAD superfamily)